MGARAPELTTDPLKGFASRVVAWMGAPNQVIPSAVWTTVRYDSRRIDSLEEWDTGAYRFTPLRAGYYYVYAQIKWDDWAGGNWSHTLAARDSAFTGLLETVDASLVNEEEMQKMGGLVYLDPSNWIEFRVRQATGVNQTILAGYPNNYVAIHRLS